MRTLTDEEKEINKARELKSIKKVMTVMSSYFPEYEITDNYDQYCSHDVNATTPNGIQRVIEIKERLFNQRELKEYANEGLILEVIKYNHLIKQNNPLYVNYINTNSYELIIVWNVNKIVNAKTKNINANKTTEFEDNDKTNKPSYLLSLDDVAISFVKHKDVNINYAWHQITSNNQLKKLINK